MAALTPEDIRRQCDHKLRSIVSSVEFKEHGIDLVRAHAGLVRAGIMASYAPHAFPAVHVRFRGNENIKCSVSAFSSGKIVIVGATSLEEDARNASAAIEMFTPYRCDKPRQVRFRDFVQQDNESLDKAMDAMSIDAHNTVTLEGGR